MKYILLFWILLLQFPLQAQEEDKNYTEAFHLAEVWLDAQRDYEKLPGITVAVVDDQEIKWSTAIGMANMEEQVSSETNTIGSICSISKLFTSVAIMQLYDQGKLRLDDLISDHLPWYDLEQQYEDSGPITIRSLLTHSSGLPREANAPYWTGPDFPFPVRSAVKEGLKDQETLYPASTYFQYSNLGLTLLGEIVAEVSGMSYDQYIEQNILQPLGLSDTRTSLPEDLYGQQLAIGYSAMTREGKRNKVNLFQANGIKPAAGFSSNVIDLAHFASWQFRLLDSTIADILKPSTLRNMYNVHWMDPDWNTTWGLGFAVYKGENGKKWVGHGGSCPGYRSTLQIDPKDKKAFVAMINSSGTNPGKYLGGIRSILGKVESMPADSARLDLDDYVGHYSSQPWWSENYFAVWGNKLVGLPLPTDQPGQAMTFFQHIEGDTFRRIRDDKSLGEALIFHRNDDGEVYRVSRHNNFSNKISIE